MNIQSITIIADFLMRYFFFSASDLRGDGIPIRWSAIESILQDCYDAKSDIWMFGHVINEIFTYGCEPFTDHYSLTTDDIIAGVLTIFWYPIYLKIRSTMLQ